MKGRRRPDGFLCYLVGWDEHLIVKAGVTIYNQRWRSMVNRGATLYALHDSGIGSGHPGSSTNLESAMELALAHHPAAFATKAEAVTFLPGGGGYLECVRTADVDTYRDALSTCSRIMLAHPIGAVLRTMPGQMHGRTDGRTYGDPHSPHATNFLFSDAHAHIRKRVVDKSIDQAAVSKS